VPRTEAAKSRYYDLPDDVLEGGAQPEQVLHVIENGAASAIAKFERNPDSPVGLEKRDIGMLAYFAALQLVRTPADRRERAYLDEFMERQLTKLRLSAQERAIRHLKTVYPGISAEEAEQRRLAMIEDLRVGKVWFESPPERQIASMFLSLDTAVEELLSRCEWRFVRFPGSCRRLVLPDRGVTVFDVNHSGVGGVGPLTSATTETTIAVSPRAALIVKPGRPVVSSGVGNDELARDLNLRAYATSDICIYGSAQADVVESRKDAKSRPRAAAERRRRPRTMWIAASPPNPDGTQEFTGYSIEGERKATFKIGPGGYTGERLTAEDLWE
jgi:hypothetical protein